MKIGVVTFPGTLDDRDAARAVRLAGGEAVSLWHADTNLHKVDAVVLPGGFSYGDYLRCGAIAAQAPVMESIIITEDQKKLINGLITAAISHWPNVGDTSILGFRGNWLVRDGLLIEKEDRWELTVEKRVYDLLIHKSPFSFSIIRSAV